MAGGSGLIARIRSDCEWAETPRRLLEGVHGGERRRDRHGQPLQAWLEIGDRFQLQSAKRHHDGSVSAWECELDSASIHSGRADYRPVENAPSGLTFEFPMPISELRREGGPEETIRIAARYAPIEVRWNGKRILEGDFLEGADYRQGWRSAEIGVFHAKTEEANGNSLELLAPARCGRRGRMTVGGILIRADELPEMERVGERWWTRVVAPANTWLAWHTGNRNRIDTGCPYWHELQRAARQAIYMAMAQAGNTIEVSRRTWEEAKLAGIELPGTTEALVPWHAEGHLSAERERGSARRMLEPQHENVIMDTAGAARPDLHVLADAAERAGVRLWKPDPALSGFNWYDRLERLVDVHVSGEAEDKPVHVTEARRAGDAVPTSEVRKVWALATLQRRDGTERKVHLSSDIAYGHQHHSDARRVGVIYTPSIKQRPADETAARIAAAAVSTGPTGEVLPLDDGAALQESAEWTVLRIRGSKDSETRELVERRVSDRIGDILAKGHQVVIRKDGDGQIAVEVGVSAPAAAPAGL